MKRLFPFVLLCGALALTAACGCNRTGPDETVVVPQRNSDEPAREVPESIRGRRDAAGARQ